jgi:hypothetical protein
MAILQINFLSAVVKYINGYNRPENKSRPENHRDDFLIKVNQNAFFSWAFCIGLMPGAGITFCF